MESFSALLAISAGNSPVTDEFPTHRPVTRSFDVIFDLRLIKDWVNNDEAGNLRHHRAHYDVIDVIARFSTNNLRAVLMTISINYSPDRCCILSQCSKQQ